MFVGLCNVTSANTLHFPMSFDEANEHQPIVGDRNVSTISPYFGYSPKGNDIFHS